MRSSRPPRGGSPGHSVGGRSLDPAALSALLRASHLLGERSRNAGIRAPGRAAIPIAPLHHASTPSRARSGSSAATSEDTRPRGPGRTAPRGRAPSLLRLLRELFATVFHLLQLGRELPPVRDIEDLPDLDLGIAFMRVRAALHPLDRLFLRLHLPQPEAGDELLRLRERPVHDGPLRAREAHPRALGAGLQALGGEHDARFHELLVELPHVGEQLLARPHARLAVLRGLDHHHESHFRRLLSAGMSPPPSLRRRSLSEIDIPRREILLTPCKRRRRRPEDRRRRRIGPCPRSPSAGRTCAPRATRPSRPWRRSPSR